ncbi:hypothetical protein NODU109028_20070 [Nocardioides dubius]|uniref:Uncharacterized protein n=1 Tax=Nocardioides dubius TaxID=317019 RepID=A0ABN1TST7_9ACTN
MSEQPTPPEGAVDAPPTPEPVEPQLAPGGVDALPDSTPGATGDGEGDEPALPRDLEPGKNPAIQGVEAPEAVTEPDDEKDQEPSSGTSGEGDTPSEPPA